MMNILITVLVVALVCYIVFWALGNIPLQEPIRTVLVVIVAIVLIAFVGRTFGLF